jgi:tetratricopeptide (TPR) repeat protein
MKKNILLAGHAGILLLCLCFLLCGCNGTPEKGGPEAGSMNQAPTDTARGQSAESKSFKNTTLSTGAADSTSGGPDAPGMAVSPSYQADLGAVHFKYRNYALAARCYAKAAEVEKKPVQVAIYSYWNARSLTAAGKKKEAFKAYGKAITIHAALVEKDAEHANFHCEKIGRIYEEIGGTDKALEWAGKIDPEKPVAPAVFLWIASLHMKKRDAEGAVKSCMTARKLARKPGAVAEVDLYLAEIHAAAGKSDEAIEILKRISREAPSEKIKAAAKAALFSLYRRLGRLDEINFGKDKAPDAPDKKKPEDGIHGKPADPGEK